MNAKRIERSLLLGAFAMMLLGGATVSVVRADNTYVSFSVGPLRVTDETTDRPSTIGASRHSPDPDNVGMRLTLGQRHGGLAGELWFSIADWQEPGSGDVGTGLGADLKYFLPLSKRIEGYARGGLASLYTRTEEGRGFTGGVGIQYKGKGSPLGLLHPLLFFLPWGNQSLTGAVFVETGIEFYRLHAAEYSNDTKINTLRFGWAFGSNF
jgi:hypothetical protein